MLKVRYYSKKKKKNVVTETHPGPDMGHLKCIPFFEYNSMDNRSKNVPITG